MSPVEFEVRHTEAGVRRAAGVLWDARYRKTLRTSFAVAVVAVTVGLVTGSLPWYLVIVLAAAILHVAYLAWQRGQVVGRAARELNGAQAPVVQYRLDDEGVSSSSTAGGARLAWSAFAGLREAGDFVFLLRSPLDAGQFIAFPRAQLPADALIALRERVAA